MASSDVLPSRRRISVNRQLAVVTIDSDIVVVLRQMPQIFTNAEYGDMLYAVLKQVTTCIDVDGGVFENVLC
jgi:hypothetical protein